MSKIAFVDVDGVVADLISVWLSRYNKDYNDNLKSFDITDWGVDAFVKPEAKQKIFSYIEDSSIYDDVHPIQFSYEGIETLRNYGFRVVFITTPSPNTYGRKLEWLIHYAFLDNKFSKDYIETRDKSLVYGDIMIDDYYKNLEGFSGKKLLFNQPWNYNNQQLKHYSWSTIIQDVLNRII